MKAERPAVKIVCSCGRRLTVLGYVDNAGGPYAGLSGPILVPNYFGKDKDLAANQLSAARFVPREANERRYGSNRPFDKGSTLAHNYDCRTCGQHWTIKHEKMLERVAKAVAAGRTTLELGVDI